MYANSAEFYDAIYIDGIGKDYPADCRAIQEIILALNPGASRILDVACGTAEHARILNGRFHVDGLDKEPRFIEIAARKLPESSFTEADMACFSLKERYDVVMCLFSAIAYLTTRDQLTSALQCFKRHLSPGGLIIVEPFIERDAWQPASSGTTRVERDGLSITRNYRTNTVGHIAELDFDFTIEPLGRSGKTGDGVRRFSEHHKVALFNRDEMLSCFSQAGLAASYDEQGLSGRGLYVARALE